MTPAGVTSGPGTLVHEMMNAAGIDNFQTEEGWRPLPLERLAYERPDLVAAAFFGVGTNHPDGWSAARHPVARAQLAERPRVDLEGAWTACGGWFVLDAVEALAGGGR
jgi:iron complex transport system substrate-binding protein